MSLRVEYEGGVLLIADEATGEAVEVGRLELRRLIVELTAVSAAMVAERERSPAA